jgi:hypothetical protein
MASYDRCNSLNRRELRRKQVLLGDLDVERPAEKIQKLGNADGIDVTVFEEVDCVVEARIGCADTELAPDKPFDGSGDILLGQSGSTRATVGMSDRYVPPRMK